MVFGIDEKIDMSGKISKHQSSIAKLTLKNNY